MRRVTAQQTRLDEQVAAYKADYERLLGEEEAARAAAAAAAERAAQARRAARPPTRRPPAPAAPAAPARRTSARSRPRRPSRRARAAAAPARTAVSTALAQVGDPYVWGAAGPGSFDCSGLTQYAYAAAGVSLPHSSGMQSQMGTSVSLSSAAPGDLLFFYSPVSHVAMYIGNGQMVHASTYGTPVKVVPVSSMPGLVSVRRVA